MVTTESPKIFARKMGEIADMLDKGEDACGRIIDQEDAHRMADKLMCDVLRHLGFGAGVEIFENMPKWYA